MISDTRVQLVVVHLEICAVSPNLCFWFDFVFKLKPKVFFLSRNSKIAPVQVWHKKKEEGALELREG